MNTNPTDTPRPAFTRAHLFIVVALIVVLLGLLIPVLTYVNYIGRETIALSNAKSIALALRLYASDHNGNYPTFTLHNGKPTKTPVTDSNTAFAQLFPVYMEQEFTFWLKDSAFCSPNPPDEAMDKTPLDTPVHTLESGENEWAYVLGLNDNSNPAVPLVASGFYNPVTHTWSADRKQKGGVWWGRNAIIVHADSSGIVEIVDQASMKLIGPNGGITNGDIFTTANSANGWLQPANVVVNPK